MSKPDPKDPAQHEKQIKKLKHPDTGKVEKAQVFGPQYVAFYDGRIVQGDEAKKLLA